MQTRDWTAAVGDLLDRISEALAGATTPEERLALSVGLALATLVVARFVLPRAAAVLDRSLSTQFVPARAADTAELLSRYAPTTLGGVLLRAADLALLVSLVVVVLVLWGRSGVVVWVTGEVAARLPFFGRLVVSVGIGFLAYVGAAVLSDTIDDLSRQTEAVTEHQEEIILRLSQLGFLLVMGLLLLSVWNVDLSNLLLGAGFLGIVVGYAARQTLGSLIAGFVLMFSRPFTIGDWVQIGDEEGIVTDITIFNTRLENFDGEFVVIPNDKVSNQAVTNRSQKGLLRLRVDVGIDYASDVERARTVAQEAVSECAEVVDSPGAQVFPKSFGDSAVVLETRFWIDHPTPPRKWKAISAVVTSVKSAFEREGIKIPFPQQELSGRAETGGFHVQTDLDGATVDPDTLEPQEQD